ncbi:MAG: hypothetical protein ACP5U1_12960 [Desulfomonilaceae bacterium]
MLGRSHYDVFPEIPDQWKQTRQRGHNGQTVTVDEDIFERSDGSIQRLSWEIRTWFTRDHSVGGIVIFSEDITSWKQVENALRQSEREKSFIVESTSEKFCYHGLDLRVRWTIRVK